MSDREKKITAYHEGGHALVAWALPHSAPVHKVTILSRARSLGHTLVLPTEDKYTQTRAELIDTLAYALGGRAAEELVFHEPTTGAGNDIEKATAIARAMVTEYGMSAKLGAVKYGQNDGEPFLGRTMGHQRDYSESVSSEIDAEVRGLIELAHDEAWEILVEYRDVLDNHRARADREGDHHAGRHGPDLRPRGQAAADGAVQHVRQAQASDQPPVLTPAEIEALKNQAEDGDELGSTGRTVATARRVGAADDHDGRHALIGGRRALGGRRTAPSGDRRRNRSDVEPTSARNHASTNPITVTAMTWISWPPDWSTAS